MEIWESSLAVDEVVVKIDVHAVSAVSELGVEAQRVFLQTDYAGLRADVHQGRWRASARTPVDQTGDEMIAPDHFPQFWR